MAIVLVGGGVCGGATVIVCSRSARVKMNKEEEHARTMALIVLAMIRFKGPESAIAL